MEDNHAESEGLWLKVAKKGSGVESVTYAEALELALCFGWIDSQKRGFDERFFLQRFTPRRPRGKWSRINRDKAKELIAAGSMRAAGLAEVEAAKADGRWEAAYEGQRTAKVPDDLQRELDRNEAAREFFAALDSANRYAILYRLEGRKEDGDARAAVAKVRRHAGARREDPLVEGAALVARRTLARMDRALLDSTLADAGEPAYRASQVWEWVARGAALLRGDDQPAGGAARAARGRGAALDPLASGRGEVRRRHRQGALPHRRRAADRGGADALPRRAPLGLRLLAVGLPADLHLLRHRADEVRPQPQRRRDPRPGAALPPRRGDRPRRLHGDGGADDEHRRRARRLRAAARPRRHPPPHRDLDRRLGAGDRPPRRVRDAGQPRALAARAQRRPALAADAGQRPLPAGRGARRLRALPGRAAAARSSSST